MLDAYEAERLPITEQVSRFAMDMAGKVLGQRRTVPDEIEQPGADGDAVRKRVGQAAYDLNVQQYCCGGSGNFPPVFPWHFNYRRFIDFL